MSDPLTGQAKASFSDKKSNVRDDTDADEEILHPTLELYRHTLLRGANMGAIVTLALGPPVLFVRGVRQPSEMLRRLSGLCVKGLGIGVGFAAVLTFVKLWNSTDDQIFDRVYRLRHNTGQVRTDKFTYGGALLGGVTGAATLPGGGLNGSLQGASVGIGLAVLAHVLSKSKQK